jgi:hypothetical protein
MYVEDLACKMGLGPCGSGHGASDIRGCPQGRYPTTSEGVLDMTDCFQYGDTIDSTCIAHDIVVVGVARCEDFLLWRLPSIPGPSRCEGAYCTVPSGLF